MFKNFHGFNMFEQYQAWKKERRERRSLKYRVSMTTLKLAIVIAVSVTLWQLFLY